MQAQRAKIAAAKAAEEQEIQRRMASSLNEPYDLSFRMPQTAKEQYDFSQ
jgi:hypothetical protein